MTKACLYQEKYRPQVHFSAAQNWLNDPNGLVFINGTYHLFYQHNPHGNVWGNMSWGHATSTDLVHWQHHPVAIANGGNRDDFVFSGSAVYDPANSSGLGSKETPPLLAFFTFSGEASENQRQAIAYSVDEGHHWQLYAGNPVIANPGIKDFRDPKVFWYEPEQHWVMLVAAGQHIKIYASDDLLNWRCSSQFGEFMGMHGGDWECPDLFSLPVDDSEIEKWVMLVSVSPGAPNGGCATQYFIGEFDGQRFIADHPSSKWIDWGPDSFAGITWNRSAGNPDKVYMAWMSNWLYAHKTPTDVWRGQMTVPRKLRLKECSGAIRLCSTPISALNTLRQQALANGLTGLMSVPEVHEGQLTVQVTESYTLAGLKLSNEDDEHMWVLIDSANKRLIIDRHHTLNTPEFPQYAYSYYADLPDSDSGQYRLHWIKDTSSIELFINDGEAVMTALLYSQKPLTQLQWCELAGQAHINDVQIYPLHSIWK